MKILYNDNEIKINYGDLVLKKILDNYTKYELTGDNIRWFESELIELKKVIKEQGGELCENY